MPLPVVCPSCQHKFNVPDAYAGKRGKCPGCAQVFRAPTVEEAQAAALATQALAEDDIPVGTAIEEPFDHSEGMEVSPPAPPFLLETPSATAKPGHSRTPSNRKHAPTGMNPLLIGGIAGGGLLVLAVIAVAVWASSGGGASKPVAVAKKPVKKSIEPAVDPEDAETFKPKTTDDKEPSKPAKPEVKPPESPPPGDKFQEDLGKTPEFKAPEPAVPSVPVPVAPPPAPEPDALSVESIQKLAEEAEKMGWKPVDETQFRRLQVLARRLTQAKNSEELPVEERTKLEQAAQTVLDKLSTTLWIGDAQLAEVNRLSAASLKSDEMGVFAYGTVIGSIPNAMGTGGRNLMVLELGGTMETIAIPVKTPVEEMPQGSRWLVLGYRVPGGQFNITFQGNGVERKIVPPMVISMHVIGEPMGK